MSLTPFYKFSQSFRDEIGRHGAYEPPADFYEDNERKVRQFSMSVVNDRIPLLDGASPSEIEQMWRDREDRLMIKRGMQNPTPVRPASPTYVPTTEIEKAVAPKQPLERKPKYDSSLHFNSHNINNQISLYSSADGKASKSKRHLRVGKPTFLTQHDTSLAGVGLKNLFDMYGIQSQFSMYRKAFSANFPDSELEKIRLGLKTARESVDFNSELFRSDLVVVNSSAMNKQDGLVGFDTIETKLKHPEQCQRWNAVTKRHENYRRTFRLPELILETSKFKNIFTTFAERENVRRLLGVTSATFPSDCCLISLEEYADLQRTWALLPKLRRVAFCLELYNEGTPVGTLTFAGHTHELTLQPGETALTIADHYCEPVNNSLDRGHLLKNTTLRFDQTKQRKQGESQMKSEEERAKVLIEIAKIAENTNHYEKLLAQESSLPNPVHRRNLLNIFNEQLAEVMSQLAQEEAHLAVLIRQAVPSLNAIPDFSTIRVDHTATSRAGFINIVAGKVKAQLPLRELEAYCNVDFKNQLVNRLKERESSIRNQLAALGFVQSHSSEFQHFMLRVKSTKNFITCRKCFRKEQPKTCICIRAYWKQILETGYITWDDYGPCGYCHGLRCYEKICDCQHDQITSLSRELERLRKRGLASPCKQCFKEFAECRCHFYSEQPSHFENHTFAGDFYGDTVAKSGTSTPGNLSTVANPDFGTPEPSLASLSGFASDFEAESIDESVLPEQLDESVVSAADQTFVPGDSYDSPPSSRERVEKQRPDGSRHCKRRGWGVPSSLFPSDDSPATSSQDPPGPLMFTELESFEPETSVEEALEFTLAAQEFISERQSSHDDKIKEQAAQGVGSVSNTGALPQASKKSDPVSSKKVRLAADFSTAKSKSSEASSAATKLNAVSNQSLVVSTSGEKKKKKEEMALTDEIVAHTASPDVVANEPGGSLPSDSPFCNLRTVQGLAVIPPDMMIVNGHLEGRRSYPIYEQPDGNESKLIPALYQAPLNDNHTDEWSAENLDMASLKRRYVKRREDGYEYCPLGTLSRILHDISRSKLPVPKKKKTEDELTQAFGRAAAKKILKARRSKETLLCLKLTSYNMEEPTDVPCNSNRPWSFRLCDLESHHGSPVSVWLQYIGQVSYTSQSWLEYQTENGRQYLRSSFPGRPTGTFVLSCGGRRTSPHRQNWPVKLSGRILTVILCGGGIQLTPAQFAAKGLSESDCISSEVYDKEPPYTEPVTSVGSEPGAKTIPQDFNPPSRVGKWEKQTKEDGSVCYQKLYWPGLGYNFSLHGFSENEKKTGHRIVFTRSSDVPVEILQAEFGLAYWMSENRESMKIRYEARCRSRRTKIQSEAFTCPFAHGCLSCDWADMVPLVSRIAGSSWRVDLENLFYSVCDDEDIIYRAGTMMTTRTDGRYVASDEYPTALDAEMIARVDESGRFIYMPEERDGEVQRYDHGYKFAAETETSRSRDSTKHYTSLETSAKETL